MTSVGNTIRTRWTPAATLQDAQAGRDLIQRGDEGDSVRQIQQSLADRGYKIDVDGKYGAETQSAVRGFQRAQGITADGIVGPETLGKLNMTVTAPVRREGVARAPSVVEQNQPAPEGSVKAGDLARADNQRRNAVKPTLAPANATPEERYNHYAAIVRANGGELSPDKATVLGLRGLSRGDGGKVRDAGSTRAYDDTFVVLKNGKAYEFRGATHPGQNSSSLSPDVNRDGRGDVGMINPGNYIVKPNGPHAGAASYWVRTQDGGGSIPGVRDTNHDGVFSTTERSASARRGDTLGEILFHQGNDSAPSSIGCQTIPPSIYQDFIRQIGGSGKSFNYTLVDAYRS